MSEQASSERYPDLHLQNGRWEPANTLEGMAEKDPDIDGFLQNDGWENFWTIGDQEGELGLLVRRRIRPDGSAQYMLEFSDVSNLSPFMVVDSFPELMDLLARWAPVVQAAAVAGAIRDLHDAGLSRYGLVELIAARAAYGQDETLTDLRRTQRSPRP